jgi:hypothetical protein
VVHFNSATVIGDGDGFDAGRVGHSVKSVVVLRMKAWVGRTVACALGVAILAFSGQSMAQAGLIGPILPYESFNDSPFKGLNFSSFELISMTNLPDGTFTVPGITVTAAGGVSVIGPGFAIDSVDGQGNNGHSLFSGCGACGITFTFDSAVLGAFPTNAGIVWTDGLRPIHFSAIDANGNSLGQIDDSSGCDFSCGDGNILLEWRALRSPSQAGN